MAAHTFTPGPWKWLGCELEQDGGEYKDVIHTEVSCGSFCYGGCVDMTVSEADGRLIASAPDLYAAAEWAANYLNTLVDANALEVLCALNIAIGKARGA